MKRFLVNKSASVAQFRSKVARTKVLNVAAPMRGGFRL